MSRLTSALVVRSVLHPDASVFSRDWDREVAGRWSYGQLRDDPAYRRSWISFDAVEYCAHDGRVHCGLSTLAGASIHWAYDPGQDRLASLGFEDVGDDYDAKIHRNFHFHHGKAYFSTAQFHDAPQQREALGGKLVAYDLKSRRYEVLGIPSPHSYIQSTAFDASRGIVYCQSYPTEQLIRFDLETRRARTLCWLGNTVLMCQAHNPVLDGAGNLWTTWGELRAWDEAIVNNRIRWLKYEPAIDRITWYEHGAPKLDEEDQGQVDALLLGPDGLIYGGTTRGGFFRLDPGTGQVESLGKPCPQRRLPALTVGPEGHVYGAGGLHSEVTLFRFDPKRNALEPLGPIVDSASGERCERVHDMTIGPEGAIYLGENDTHDRTSRLWICRLTSFIPRHSPRLRRPVPVPLPATLASAGPDPDGGE